jgi:hypothetical protein
MHEPFCLKNVIKCEICLEPVNREEIEDHQTEAHTRIDCTDCGKKFEKKLLTSHKKKCNHKQSNCEYCEIQITKDELHDHEYVCGSKTDECTVCFKPVMLRERELHLMYMCGKREPQKQESKKSSIPYTGKTTHLDFQKTMESLGKLEEAHNKSEQILGRKKPNEVRIKNSNIDNYINVGSIKKSLREEISKKKEKVTPKKKNNKKVKPTEEILYSDQKSADRQILESIIEMSKFDQ